MFWKGYAWVLGANAVVVLAAAGLVAQGAWRTTAILMIALFAANMIAIFRIRKKHRPVSSTTRYVKWAAGLGMVFIISGVIAVVQGILRGFSSDIRVGGITVFLLGGMYLRIAWKASHRIQR